MSLPLPPTADSDRFRTRLQVRCHSKGWVGFHQGSSAARSVLTGHVPPVLRWCSRAWWCCLLSHRASGNLLQVI